ncbi:O-Antigen ligase [compost metagenome]
MSGRSVWVDYALAAPLPLAIFAAHAAGGARGPEAGLMLTAAAAIGLLMIWRTVQATSTALDYRPLYPAAASFLGLLVYVAWTAWQPSSGLPRGPLAALVGSSKVSIQPDETVLELTRLTGLAAAVAGGFILGADPKRARRTINLFLALGLAWTLASLSWFLASGQPRLSAPFVSPNVAACLLLCLLFPVLARTVRRLARARGRLVDRAVKAAPYAAYAALLIVCLTLTASRSALALAAILGPLMVAALLLKARPRQGIWVAGAAAVFGLGLTGLIIFADRGVFVRLSETTVDASDRWSILSAYWTAFLQSPVHGFGLGTAPTLAKMSMTPDNYDALWNIRAVHNVYLQWLVEGGVVGATLMFATLACLILLAVKGAMRGVFSSLAPFFAIDLVFLVQGLSDYPLQIPSLAMTWALFLGLQTAVAAAPVRRRRTSSPE